MSSEISASPETPELLKAMEERIDIQSQPVAEQVDRIEGQIRASLFGIPLPGTLFCPAKVVGDMQRLREIAANDNDSSLIKKAA